MDLMYFMELMGTSNIPLLAAFFIGLMTAISPCPMATNMTAIAAVSRRLGENRKTVLVGFAYTAGRMLTYITIASLIVWIGVSTQATSFFLQGNAQWLLGPLLIAIGVLMSGKISFPTLPGASRFSSLKENLSERGATGGFLLGVIFAMAFCPFSAALFFGMLIPIALAAGDGIIIPSVFAFATGLPVIVFSFILAYSLSRLGSMMNRIQSFDKWMRRAVSVIFIVVGVYSMVSAFVV